MIVLMPVLWTYDSHENCIFHVAVTIDGKGTGLEIYHDVITALQHDISSPWRTHELKRDAMPMSVHSPTVESPNSTNSSDTADRPVQVHAQ